VLPWFQFRGLFIYLTPFVPLSFKGEGEGYKKRGFVSLGLSLYGAVMRDGEATPFKVITKGCLRGASAPLRKNLPLPLSKGKGIQGMGL